MIIINYFDSTVAILIIQNRSLDSDITFKKLTYVNPNQV